MDNEDVKNWLIRNKDLISFSGIERAAGIQKSYINIMIMRGGEIPNYKAPPQRIQETYDKVREVVMKIRAF